MLIWTGAWDMYVCTRARAHTHTISILLTVYSMVLHTPQTMPHQHYLLFSHFTSTLELVNVGLLEDNVGVTATNTPDGSHGEHNLTPAIDVGVHQTQDMLELFRYNQRLLREEYIRTHNHQKM